MSRKDNNTIDDDDDNNNKNNFDKSQKCAQDNDIIIRTEIDFKMRTIWSVLASAAVVAAMFLQISESNRRTLTVGEA